MDSDRVIEVIAKHTVMAKIGMCCGYAPCPQGVLIAEIKRLNDFAVEAVQAFVTAAGEEGEAEGEAEGEGAT